MYCLGKREAQPGAIKLQLASYLIAAKLPTPPTVFGRPELIKEWDDLGNNSVGDCVLAGGAHESMLWNVMAGRHYPQYSDASVISDYSALTGYVPGNKDTDQGTYTKDVCKYRQNIGLLDATGIRHKIGAYAAMRRHDLEQLALATYLLGAVGVGIELPKSAIDQLEAHHPWDYVHGSEVLGGHYIPCVGRNSHGHFLFVTWGQLIAVTPAFLEHYMDEGVAYFSQEWLKPDMTQRGFKGDELRADLERITT